ncbi:hypothetical protein [Paenibacillus sp. sgz500958]|uniref:hypothetical protein n=1 Tax=Paenibacillus sp. sgz500958 TaxID=3242475 RepID=UPI0036D32E63
MNKTRLALGFTIILSVVTFITSVGINPTAAAVTTQENSAVYRQFQQYLKNPATLAQARKYLINHIDEVSVWNATVMTLHLENAQKAQLAAFAEKIYSQDVQIAIEEAAKKKDLTYTGLLSVIKDPKIRAILVESRDKGYKIRNSEGMSYPVMNYEGFKVLKPFITKDIAEYINIMARESSRPSMSDAAVVISWEELISRALAQEVFVKTYPNSNRTAVMKQEYGYSLSRVFYGSSNTPAYDSADGGKTGKLDPELRQAYEEALKNGTGSSSLLAAIEGLLKLLDTTGDVLTPDVEKYLEAHVV